jgi:hypothetical protein
MHFEILVEDYSGKVLLEILLPKLINTSVDTYKTISYKGIGRLPRDLKTTQDPSKRILLEQLPRLLRGYGKTYQSYNAILIVVLDCDRRNCIEFKKELVGLLESCNPKPTTFFRIAIEEMEAWLLGDQKAIKSAYPSLKERDYSSYVQDSIIGTWEKLADLIYPGGSFVLSKKPFFEIGKQKAEWAQQIGNGLDIQNNRSPSFNCFVKTISQNKTI